MKYQAIAANSKIYFGQDIPNMFVEGNNSPPKSAHSSDQPSTEPDLLGKLEGQWVHELCLSAQHWDLCCTCFVWTEGEGFGELCIMFGDQHTQVWAKRKSERNLKVNK